MLKLNKGILILFLSLALLGGTIGQSWAAQEKVNLTVQIPFSMKGKGGVALPGSTINGYFLLESQAEEPLEIQLEVLLPAGFVPKQLANSWQQEKRGANYLVRTKTKLVTQLDNWFDLLPLQVDQQLAPGSYLAEVRTTVNGQVKVNKYPLTVSSPGEMNSWVQLKKLILPVDEEGRRDSKYQTDTITLRESSTEFFRSVFRGTGAVDTIALDNHPLTHLGVVLQNTTPQAISLQISTQLLDQKTREPVAAFHLPENEGVSQKKGEIQLLTDLKGGEQKTVAVPIYLEEGKVKGGQYLLQTTVKLLGSNMLLATEEKEIQVIVKDYGPLVVTTLAFSLCLLAIAVFLWQQKKILAGFKTKELILIALFGTATFLSVNIPGTIFNDLAHVFLGPFSFLITGIFNGIILYMLLISLVILIPRPGVIWLVSMVRIMLNGIALGHFTPLLVLFYLSGALFLELALYGVGLTRPSGLQSKLTSPRGFSKEVFLLALFCAVADVVASYVNFQGIIFLYRLYYASWYIAFYLLVSGLFYTAVGACLGVILGHKLQKISTD